MTWGMHKWEKRGGEPSEGWKKTRRFCKEPKTFSQDILLILNRSVSASRLLSFVPPSRSRSFFLNCRLPPWSARTPVPRAVASRAFPLSQPLRIIPRLSPVHITSRLFISLVINVVEGKRALYRKGRSEHGYERNDKRLPSRSLAWSWEKWR